MIVQWSWFCTKAALGQGVTLRGEPGLGQELLQVTLRAPGGGTAVMPSPWSGHCTPWQSALPPWPLQQDSPSTWDFLEHFPALLEEIHGPGAGGRQKVLLWTSVWTLLPPETSSLAMDTWICVCRKKKDLFSLPQCLQFSACFCHAALVLQVGQCCRTFSETSKIWSIYGYSDEAVECDGKPMCVVIPGCSAQHAHGGVRMWLLWAGISGGWWCYNLVLEDCQWWATPGQV